MMNSEKKRSSSSSSSSSRLAGPSISSRPRGVPIITSSSNKNKNTTSLLSSEKSSRSNSLSSKELLPSPIKLSSPLVASTEQTLEIGKISKNSNKQKLLTSERISYFDKESSYRRDDHNQKRSLVGELHLENSTQISLTSIPLRKATKIREISPISDELYGDSLNVGSRSRMYGRELEESTCTPFNSQYQLHSSKYKPTEGRVLEGTSYDMSKYFGENSRLEFFDRFHYVSTKRESVQRDRKPEFQEEQDILIKLITNDPFSQSTNLCDYPFAPHRHDEELNDDLIDNPDSSSLFDNRSRDSLSTTALIFPYDHEVDLSPRTKYINGCLAHDINPRASLVLRKNVSTILNLQHHGMGDKHGVVFADSLRHLPMVHTINLADNNLTDISLSPIVEAIIALPSVTDIDLSQNKIDGQCSVALAAYLQTPSCSLKRLVLRSADIDDTEAENFVKSLMSNTTLQELDLSRNLIGRAESLNTVRPEFNTGAEALASLLQNENSHLEKLCLAWNMIRLDSAVALASSLAWNSHLRYLDLSYNSLGEKGGEYLGKSLLTNNILQTLLINHNNLTSSSCFCICVGIEENYSLQKVNLDGNPIGEFGAKCVTHIPVTLGGRVKVSATECNLDVLYEKDKMFNIYDPCGSYALDLQDCYHRAIAFKILRILASNSGYIAQAFAWSPYPLPPLEMLRPPPPPPIHTIPTKAEMMMLQRRAPKIIPPPTAKKIRLKREVQKFKWEDLDETKRSTLEGLFHIQAAARNISYAKELFREFDRDQSGALDIDELMKLFTTLGITTDRADIALAISSCESENKDELTWNDFLEFLRIKEQDASHRIREMVESPIIVEQNTGKRYIPPLTGSLYIELIDEFNIAAQKVLSSEDHSHMVEFVKHGVENLSKALQFSIANTRVREKEALQLHELLNTEIKNNVTVAEIILAQIADPHDARSYIYKIFGYDRESVKRLEFNLGSAMKPILGIYDGYYLLDLSVASDRLCLKKLLEQSQLRKDKSIKDSLFEPGLTGDLSQNGDWSCFRNAFYNGSQCYVRPDLFSPMPTEGILSFDFFGSDRPPRDVSIIPDSRCLNIMTNAAFITQDEKFGLQLILNDMKLKSKNSFQFAGNPNGEKLYTKDKAEDIQLVKLVFYQMLPKRAKYYKAVRVMECDTGGIVKYTEGQQEKEENKKKKTRNLYLKKLNRKDNEDESLSSSSDSDSDNDSAIELVEDNTFNSNTLTTPTKTPVGRRFSMLRRQSALETSPTIPKRIIPPTTTLNSFPTIGRTVSPPFRPRKFALATATKQEYIYDINSKMVTIQEANVNKNVKSYRIVENLVDIISRLWIRCRHLAVIVQYFNSGRIDRVKYFGTYRVELIIQVYCRIVDLHNFDLILEILSAFEIGCLTCRIGILSYFNPLKLDSWHCLDLSKREERIAAKILAYLSTVEPGKNWIEPTFRWGFQLPCIPGWMLTQSWLEEQTMPYRGILTVEYFSGQGRGLLGCNPAVAVRKSLLALVAITEEEIVDDEHNRTSNGETLHIPNTGVEEAQSRKDIWMKLLSPSDSTSAKIANGEDILTTLIDEQNLHNLSHHIKHEVASDDESDDGKQIANIVKMKSIASKMLNRQRSKITEMKRPMTAPSATRGTIRMTTINMRRDSKLK